MSSPRDRDPDEGSDWQEPHHLSGNEPAGSEPDIEPNIADRRMKPRDDGSASDRQAWQPPGWDLPDATPDRDRRPDADPSWPPPDALAQDAPPPPAQERTRGGFFGSRPRARGEVEKVFTYEGDVAGAQGWALQQGWTISDGNAPEDAVLRDLVASAPVRPTKDHRPASVLRGRSGALDLVAFDIVYASGRYLVPEYAVTAAPLLGAVPGLRLSPARLWKHRTGGLVPIPSGNEAFDTRWQLLAAEDAPQVRRLAQDPAVHGLLLGTDDKRRVLDRRRAPRRRPARRAPPPAARAPRPPAERGGQRAVPRLLSRPVSTDPHGDGGAPAAPDPGHRAAPTAGLRDLLPLLRPHRRALAVAAGLSLAGAAAALAQPALVGQVITAVGGGQSLLPPSSSSSWCWSRGRSWGRSSSTCCSGRRRASSSPPGGSSPTGCCGCPCASTTGGGPAT